MTRPVAKALHADLNRHDFESLRTEIEGAKKDILAHLDHVDEWAADESHDVGFSFGTLAGARIRKDPLGVALVIAPRNVPTSLIVTPMVSSCIRRLLCDAEAVRISNCVARLLVEIIPEYLARDAIEAVTGAARETSMIFERRFDYTFYTGSVNFARKVLVAAAKHLTTTVLEVEGQNPCLVTATASINLAAKYIPPAVFTNVHALSILMPEEIFAPLIPIVKADYQPACEMMQKIEHPLGLYILGTDKIETDAILSKTSSGDVTVNDIMLHVVVENTPFGGVGNSGSGTYHVKHGFEAFTHNRPVVPVPGWFEYLFSCRYPPYGMKHVSRITVKIPCFKRGETVEDQRVGSSTTNKVSKLLGTSKRWAAVAVIPAVVDARMRGKAWLLEVLRSVMGGLRSRLPRYKATFQINGRGTEAKNVGY